MTDHGSNIDPGTAETDTASTRSASDSGHSEETPCTVAAESQTATADGPIAQGSTTAAEPTAISQDKTPQEEQTGEDSGRKCADSGFWGLVQSFAITIVIALYIITFVVQAFQIPSQSMEDTLLVGDYLLVDKAKFGQSQSWSWLLPYREIKRGDVIVFRYPVDPEKHFVKRVVAIPGDHLHMLDGQLYVNGKLQSEPYTVHKMPFPDSYRDDFPNGGNFRADVSARWWHEMPDHLDNGELVVPKNCYFAMGDNRDDSLDSRYWGFVPRQNIVGRPLLIYFSHEVSSEPAATDLSDKLARLANIIVHFAGSVRWNRTLRIIH